MREIRNKKSEVRGKIVWLLSSVFLLPASCLLLLSSALCFLFSDKCYAQVISSRELIENAQEYDGKIVTYQGEVIGEVLRRKKGTWLNLYDGKGAIGVWVPKEVLFDIVYSGGYKSVGDRLSVVGEFHRSCLIHGGDLDIHARQIVPIQSGKLRPEKVSVRKQKLLTYLSGILLCILVISIILKKKQRLP